MRVDIRFCSARSAGQPASFTVRRRRGRSGDTTGDGVRAPRHLAFAGSRGRRRWARPDPDRDTGACRPFGGCAVRTATGTVAVRGDECDRGEGANPTRDVDPCRTAETRRNRPAARGAGSAEGGWACGRGAADGVRQLRSCRHGPSAGTGYRGREPGARDPGRPACGRSARASGALPGDLARATVARPTTGWGPGARTEKDVAGEPARIGPGRRGAAAWRIL